MYRYQFNHDVDLRICTRISKFVNTSFSIPALIYIDLNIHVNNLSTNLNPSFKIRMNMDQPACY